MGKKSRKGSFFEKDTIHGLVKRILFKKYIQAYIECTQCDDFSLRTMILDGFAGSGRYSTDWPEEIEKYGSPLIALMVTIGVFYRKYLEQMKKGEKYKAFEGDLEAEVNNEAKKEVESSADKMENFPNGASEGETDQTTDKQSLWGWPDLQLDPDEELAAELKECNRRQSYSSEVKPADVSLIFIESDRKTFKRLTENVELLLLKFLKDYFSSSYKYGFSSDQDSVQIVLKTYPFSISIQILKRKFEDTKPPSEFNNPAVRSLTFLDPFGFTQTPMSHVAKFAPGPGNEVLINFMSSFVNRFVSRNTQGVANLYGLSEYEEVASIYGIDPPDLSDVDSLVEFVKYVILSSRSESKIESFNNIHKYATAYETFLRENTESKYSLLFEVKGKGNTTIFYMVYFTNHIRGVECMKEAMNRCSQKGGELVMSDYDILRKGLKLNLGNLDDPMKVADTVFTKFKGKNYVRLQDIKEFVLLETNYVFRKKPLAMLRKEGKITKEIDTDGKLQKQKCKSPNKDKKTKKPKVWLVSFADDDFLAKQKLEKERKKAEREEKAKKKQERIRRKEELKAKRRKMEERKREKQASKDRKMQQRLDRRRKKEERRKQIENDKRKREQAKLEKEMKRKMAEQRKIELEKRRMRSQNRIDDMFIRTKRVDDSEVLTTPTRQLVSAAGDNNYFEDANKYVGNTNSETGIRDKTNKSTAEAKRNSTRKGAETRDKEKDKENKKKQTRLTDKFVSVKGPAQGLSVNTDMENRSQNEKKKDVENSRLFGHGKRKSKNAPGSEHGGPAKRVKVLSATASTPETIPCVPNADRNGKEGGRKPFQKALTDYYPRKNES